MNIIDHTDIIANALIRFARTAQETSMDAAIEHADHFAYSLALELSFQDAKAHVEEIQARQKADLIKQEAAQCPY